MANQNGTPGSSRLGELFGMGQQAWQLFANEQVPLGLKLLPVLAALYVISPLDFMPDVVPIAGQLDDVAILLIALKVFTSLAGRHAAQQTPASTTTVPPGSQPSVSATYRVRED